MTLFLVAADTAKEKERQREGKRGGKRMDTGQGEKADGKKIYERAEGAEKMRRAKKKGGGRRRAVKRERKNGREGKSQINRRT